MYIYWLMTIWCARKQRDSLKPLTWEPEGSVFKERQVRSSTGEDLCLPVLSVLWIPTSCPLSKSILCSISWPRQKEFTTKIKIAFSVLWTTCNYPKCTAGKLLDKLLLDRLRLCCHMHNPISLPQHVLSLDDSLLRNCLRNAHPLEKREKLG